MPIYGHAKRRTELLAMFGVSRPVLGRRRIVEAFED
jgi:hypothetical protein